MAALPPPPLPLLPAVLLLPVLFITVLVLPLPLSLGSWLLLLVLESLLLLSLSETEPRGMYCEFNMAWVSAHTGREVCTYFFRLGGLLCGLGGKGREESPRRGGRRFHRKNNLARSRKKGDQKEKGGEILAGAPLCRKTHFEATITVMRV